VQVDRDTHLQPLMRTHMHMTHTCMLCTHAEAGALLEKGEKVLKLTDYFEENGTFHEDFFMDDVEDVIGVLGSSLLASASKKSS